MNPLKSASLLKKISSSMLLLGLSVLGIGTQVYAQSRVDKDGVHIEAGKPKDNNRDPSGGKGDRDKGSAARDPNPALTAATNDYNEKVAAWQTAYQKHQAALTRLEDVKKARGLGAWIGNPIDVIAIRVASDEVDNARLELDEAEKQRNQAHEVAKREALKVAERDAAERKARSDDEKARRNARDKEPAGGNRDRP